MRRKGFAWLYRCGMSSIWNNNITVFKLSKWLQGNNIRLMLWLLCFRWRFNVWRSTCINEWSRDPNLTRCTHHSYHIIRFFLHFIYLFCWTAKCAGQVDWVTVGSAKVRHSGSTLTLRGLSVDQWAAMLYIQFVLCISVDELILRWFLMFS